MSEALRINDVSFIYHGKNEETLAISHLDLSILSGEFLGVVGPSGSGKTTLLSLMAGILKPSSGEIITPSGSLSTDVGYMLQRDQLFGWRSIWKNVTLGLELKGKKDKSGYLYAEELLKKYGLYEVKDRYPPELSGGMRQRAALIRTLVLRPRVILLDEPFSALDFQTRLAVGEDVRKIIKGEGLTAVLVTHDISEAISLCDRVAVLSPKPARVKSIHDTNLSGIGCLEKRAHGEFSTLFGLLWKELEVHEEEYISGTQEVP